MEERTGIYNFISQLKYFDRFSSVDACFGIVIERHHNPARNFFRYFFSFKKECSGCTNMRPSRNVIRENSVTIHTAYLVTFYFLLFLGKPITQDILVTTHDTRFLLAFARVVAHPPLSSLSPLRLHLDCKSNLINLVILNPKIDT